MYCFMQLPHTGQATHWDEAGTRDLSCSERPDGRRRSEYRLSAGAIEAMAHASSSSGPEVPGSRARVGCGEQEEAMSDSEGRAGISVAHSDIQGNAVIPCR